MKEKSTQNLVRRTLAVQGLLAETPFWHCVQPYKVKVNF